MRYIEPLQLRLVRDVISTLLLVKVESLSHFKLRTREEENASFLPAPAWCLTAFSAVYQVPTELDKCFGVVLDNTLLIRFT